VFARYGIEHIQHTVWGMCLDTTVLGIGRLEFHHAQFLPEKLLLLLHPAQRTFAAFRHLLQLGTHVVNYFTPLIADCTERDSMSPLSPPPAESNEHPPPPPAQQQQKKFGGAAPAAEQLQPSTPSPRHFMLTPVVEGPREHLQQPC
jgi:hypothetical protein